LSEGPEEKERCSDQNDFGRSPRTRINHRFARLRVGPLTFGFKGLPEESDNGLAARAGPWVGRALSREIRPDNVLSSSIAMSWSNRAATLESKENTKLVRRGLGSSRYAEAATPHYR
jgi:hypothetical protein